MLCSPLAADYAAPQADAKQRQRHHDCQIADCAAGVPQDRQEETHNGQPDVQPRDGAMVIPRDDQPLVEVGAVGGEDLLAVAKAPEEGERGVEGEGPDEQHPGYDQQAEVADEQVAVAQDGPRAASLRMRPGSNDGNNAF